MKKKTHKKHFNHNSDMESVNSFPRGVIIKWIINFMPIFNMYIFIFQKSFKKNKNLKH